MEEVKEVVTEEVEVTEEVIEERPEEVEVEVQSTFNESNYEDLIDEEGSVENVECI